MNIRQCKHLVLLGFVSLVLAACSSTSSDDAQGAGAGAGADGVATGAVGDGGVGGMGAGSGGYDGGGLETVFYFDFDNATLRPESRAALQQHAANLTSNPQRVRLEGHADERGTREYNMALGERRANAVRDFLVLNGVDGGLLEVISYGEESPAAFGSDETSMAQNRRVQMK